MASGMSIEELLWTVGALVPIGFAWLFALYFCFTRHRENPRGAVFLGIAILLEMTLYTLSYLPRILLPQEVWTDLFSNQWFFYGTRLLHTLFSTVMWILIAMAVFSRRSDQYADLS